LSRGLRIALLSNTKSPNVGNGALALGMKNSFYNHLNQQGIEAPKFFPISWDDITFGGGIFPKSFFSTVNTFDALWVAGAVTFNGRAEHIFGGCRLNWTRSDLDSLRVPIILGGISYRHWQGTHYPNKGSLLRLLQDFASRERVVMGFRNDGTVDWLKQEIGWESMTSVEVPDPGYYAYAPSLRTTQCSGMIFTFNMEDANERFSGKDSEEALTDALVETISNFWNFYDENIIFAPHSIEDYSGLLKVISKLPKKLVHQNLRVLPMPSPNSIEEIYDSYKSVRVAISTRVHSMSPSIGMGTPTVIISTQERIQRFVTNIGMGDYMTEPMAARLKLSEMTMQLTVDSTEFIRRQEQATAKLDDLNFEFYSRVCKMLSL
jgi:hypothetical protein